MAAYHYEAVGSVPLTSGYAAELDAEDRGRRGPDVLTRARAVVRGERCVEYGSPGKALAQVGQVWGALLGMDGDIPPRTVALMMCGLKIVRATNRIDDDDLIDLAGYALLASESE